MTETILDVDTVDVRFPTSDLLIGSDAMNPDPDYSAAYVVVRTSGDEPDGHGFSFTIGRGNEVVLSAVEALKPLVVGQPIPALLEDLGSFSRTLTGDSQLRWIGPEKGAIHLATAAVVNAVWDLAAKRAGKPLWKLLSDLSPAELVALVDFRYIDDALSADEATDLLERQVPERAERERQLRATGLPAYTTSVGWMGYPDDKIQELCAAAVDDGFEAIKMKVGCGVDDDRRRARILRDIIGPDRRLMMDANQRWGVTEAIEYVAALREFDPWWVEEPTSPDDVLGHARIAKEIAPIRVATGEHVHNRVMFKQLFQASAIGFCQIDACRLAGVNEVIAVLLLAAKHGIPVCPHAGGVGLCEYVQHLAAFDYIAVSGPNTDRVVEHVDHLHEHFLDPVEVDAGRYRLPTRPGYSAEMRAESLATYRFPNGAYWSRELRARR